ncbi:MAG: hypothetical protein C0603_10435 [Denitrovibrio sp.]|nr:MAG: hypothetical protein C0603_10435 [Denitrovibrio sp.]
MDNYSFTAFFNKLKRAQDVKTSPGAGLNGVKIAKQASESVKKNGKALVFTKEIPVAVNLLASTKKLKVALGYTLSVIAEQAHQYITEQPEVELSYCEMEYYDDFYISELPISKHYKTDVSGSINMGCVISKDRDIHNCGIYRIQPLDDEKAVIHCAPESGLGKQLSKGEDVPVTIAVGTTPHLIYAAAATLPDNIDELKLAAYLHPEEMKFVKTSLYPVPFDTQIIIQGRVSATETHPEGPFTIHTGGQSAVEDFPVLHIESVMISATPIYQTTVTGEMPMESAHILRAANMIQFNRVHATNPNIMSISHPIEGVFFKEVDVHYIGDKAEVEKLIKEDEFYGKFEKINLLQDEQKDSKYKNNN